jgi:cytochrome c-type biogenesis protein CcmH/NrfG
MQVQMQMSTICQMHQLRSAYRTSLAANTGDIYYWVMMATYHVVTCHVKCCDDLAAHCHVGPRVSVR